MFIAQSGLALLAKMDAAGVPPNEVSYTTIINGYTRSGNLKVNLCPYSRSTRMACNPLQWMLYMCESWTWLVTTCSPFG